MEYLSICFEEQCRLGNRQILCLGTHDSQLHQSHAVEAIHPHSPFIRSFKTQPIKFKEIFLNVHSQLQEQYKRSVQRVKSALRVGLQQSERRIRDIYELNEKEVTFKLFEPHLRQRTSQTELWLSLLNWKKAHPTEDINNYIQSMPQSMIKDYTTITNNLVESLISNLPKSQKGLCKKSSQPNTKELQAYLKGGSKLIQEISKQIQQIYVNIVKPKDSPKLPGIPCVIKAKDLTQKTLMQLAEWFCRSESLTLYRYIGNLRIKLATEDIFRLYLGCLIRRVCSKIEEGVSKDRRDPKMMAASMQLYWIELLRYRQWMHKNEAAIFLNCVRLFMGIQKDIVISPEMIERVYVVIICKMIDREIKSGYEMYYIMRDQPLQKQLIYLYSKLRSFQNVEKIVIRKYPTQPQAQLKQTIKKRWKKIVVGTYTKIQNKYQIQNTSFQSLILQEEDFGKDVWGNVVLKYANYKLQGYLDKFQEQSLVEAMTVVVKNRLPLEGISDEVKQLNEVKAKVCDDMK